VPTTQTAPSEKLRDGWEPDTPSSDTVLLAGFRAMMARSVRTALAAGGRVCQDDETVLADAVSTCRYLNEVLTTRPLDDLLLARAFRFYPPGRPFVVCSPPGPRARVETAHGLRLVGHPPFMFRPPGGHAPPPPPEVTVEEVVDAGDLAICGQIVAAAFGESAVRLPAALLGGPHRFWLARWRGEPAATASAFVSDHVVDVEAVATLPDFRRRGLAAAVTWAATLAAPALPAILLASDPGRPVYERMGYYPLIRVTMWTADP
jgi:GNAT superfamily N-acetyltransferase